MFKDKNEKKFLVSCQAYESEVLYGADNMVLMAKSAELGGADALRICWPETIRKVKAQTSLPIVGINKIMTVDKNLLDDVIITPEFSAAVAIAEAGADIIAFDGTLRKRTKEELATLIGQLKTLQKPLMADISSFAEGIFCFELGVEIISTTLSGYTRATYQENQLPDFRLITQLKEAGVSFVNAEGRYWQIDQVNQAYQLGADSVTVGTAITRPEDITRHFVQNLIRE